MKKILSLIIGILLMSIPTASAMFSGEIGLLKLNAPPFEKHCSTTGLSDWFDGSFSGWFGVENESNDYNVLGYLQGYYNSRIGFFVGKWNASDRIVSGDIVGFFRNNILIALFKIGLSNKIQIGVGLPLFGRYEINETTHEFEAQGARLLRTNIYIYCQYEKFEE